MNFNPLQNTFLMMLQVCHSGNYSANMKIFYSKTIKWPSSFCAKVNMPAFIMAVLELSLVGTYDQVMCAFFLSHLFVCTQWQYIICVSRGKSTLSSQSLKSFGHFYFLFATCRFTSFTFFDNSASASGGGMWLCFFSKWLKWKRKKRLYLYIRLSAKNGQSKCFTNM